MSVQCQYLSFFIGLESFCVDNEDKSPSCLHTADAGSFKSHAKAETSDRDTMQFCRVDEDGLDCRTWTSLDLEELDQDVMQDMMADVMQDVMLDVSMCGDIPVYSSLTADCYTQDAMMQGLTMRTAGGTKKHTVSCHQPPWKVGCSHGIGQNRGGADKHGRRYCYECTSCGSKWNQTRPELLYAGEDANVRESNRCTNVSDKRRSNGYKCRVCGGKKNAAAHATGTLLCACPRKTKVQRDQPSSAILIATRVPSALPLVRDTTRIQSAPPAFFVKAARKHPRIKPGGISLCKWRELLAATEC